jgi:hypothetical protein
VIGDALRLRRADRERRVGFELPQRLGYGEFICR